MIRQMVRRSFIRELITLATVVGVTTSGTPSLFAAASNGPQERPNASVSLEKNKAPFQVRSPQLPTLSAQDIAQARQEILALQNRRGDQATVERAKRALLWLDILSAKTAAERHDAIRRLPVTIVLSTPTDGRLGVMKSFVTRGKTRTQVFIPARTSKSLEPEADELPSSGPHVSDTGRWKLDGQGGCYWEPNDDGPDQCDPTEGRWKLDGQGGCYWDDTDPGPNQCDPPQDYCYYEGVWGDCATEQEIDDALIVAAEAEAEVADLESEADANWAELEAYCDQNPFECDGPNSYLNVGGPSASASPCSSEKNNFVAAALTTNGSIIGLVAIATAPISVPAAAIVGAAVVVLGGLYWMRSAGTSLYDCKAAIVYLPGMSDELATVQQY